MINIIRHRAHDKSILSRKAQVLVDRLGWSITSSEQPDPGAFLNYAFPYLDYRRDPQLPFAAYFTHREDCRPGKVDLWETQAKRAVLRITSAQQYYDDLCQYGPTVKILPPLDRDKFVPGLNKSARDKPIIGVAGFVYAGGRKGEHLVKKVANSLFDFKFMAIGHGWPIPTTSLPYAKLEEFYQHIDIFLCTSTIEGVPYPPLEALACGTKVVIPSGVGLLDELPDIPGIERYTPDNYDEMVEAIYRCSENEVDQEQLRESTSIFSEDTWAYEHEKAFNEYKDMFVELQKKERESRRKDRGIYVVAYGDNANRCARRLIKSVRSHMPDCQVAVVADKEIPEADINIEIPDGMDVGGRVAKLNAYQLAPKIWDQVIYLDADTELMESIDYFFHCLDEGWEMVFTKDINSRHTVNYLYRKKAPNEYQQVLEFVGSDTELALAGGVWAFRRCKGAKTFLSNWIAEWGEGKYRDQPTMLIAFYKSKVRALFIGSEWNSFTNARGQNRFEIIRHYDGAQARSHVKYSAPPEFIVINNSNARVERAGRVFNPGDNSAFGLNERQLREIRACSSLDVMRQFQ